MPDPTVTAALAKQFEPILLFHQQEVFLPIDPKWYLEHCALWRASPKFDDKNKWGEPPFTILVPRLPQILKHQIAALANEASGSVSWLGNPGSDFGVGPVSMTESTPSEEHFLEFAGWEPVVAPPKEVTATSNNSHAALNPTEYNAPLKDSRQWYYVEYLDNQALLQFTGNPNINVNGLDLSKSIVNNPDLNKPGVLLFHFLYPLHQEALEGCQDAGEGALFGTYAGEWACIALLIDSTNAPVFIGLTSRNVGDPAAVVGAEDQRVGMTIFDWKQVDRVKSDGNAQHPKIFVSLGTHGSYLKPGPHTVTPFTPSGIDPSRQSCGQVEALDDAISAEVIGIPATKGADAQPIITIAKALAAGAAGLVVAGPLGGLAGVVAGALGWAGIEGAFGTFGSPQGPPLSPTQPTDQTGSPDFGVIIRPDGLPLPEESMAKTVIDWAIAPYTSGGRSYDFVVDRTTQVWWVPRPAPRPNSSDLPGGAGFNGRWGPRVTNDSNTRRAGMKCPDFLVMFLEAIAIDLNK